MEEEIILEFLAQLLSCNVQRQNVQLQEPASALHYRACLGVINVHDGELQDSSPALQVLAHCLLLQGIHPTWLLVLQI